MRRKKDDPVQDKSRAERNRCRTWLEILCQGIGRQLTTISCRDAHDARELIERVNTELLAAVEASEAADKAYEPYWQRRIRPMRPRRTISRNPKPTKKESAA